MWSGPPARSPRASTARRRPARLGRTSALVALSIVATSCGARLDPAVRDSAIAGSLAPSAVVAPSAADSPGPSAVSSPGTPTVPGLPGSSAAPPASGGVPSNGGAVVDGAPLPSGPTQPGAGPGQAADTRSAPAGGNGGATDVGVFEDRIVIGNAVDNSGAVPGIFIDAQLAVQAFERYFAATEGTIYGRRLELRTRDSRLDANGNREAYLDFCDNVFAGIGSMSAFDEGIIDPVSRCGIPDIRSAVVNGRTMELPTVFSADAISITQYPTNHYLYWAETYPGAADKAAILYVDNDTTHQQTRLMRAVAEQVGYTYVVDRKIGLAETNYSSYALELKEKGVTFVEFQGDTAQATRLAKSMRQQGYWPTVYALQQNLYKPSLIQQGGVEIEGAELALGSVMNENIAHHPELQTYRTWLKQVDPQAEPTGQGAYAWGAALLFVELAKQIGPDLTREKLVDALLDVHDFDGNGLFPPQDIGGRIPTNCHIMAKVENGRFVPTSPGDGRTFECRGRTERA